MGEDSKEIRITYETLYEVLRREKSKDELQKLEESFFRDVLEYLQEKTRIVQEAAGKFDMFSVEEKENTQIQLNNVRRILKEIYERREKKIIEMALNKSKTNSNIIDTTNLLAKEHELYNETIKILDGFRKDILLSLLELKAPEIKQPPEPVPEPPAPEPEPSPPEPVPKPEPATSSSEPAKVKVKFLQKVEQFVGKELELYGPFEPETTAELPKEIADILVNKGSASIAE
ncbi:hypothetical protein KY338_00305 [Candidatus Woesearchaeota archaeon]|nr:hypothetical protein [Candidatus Woesearchaeota archaeon]MBW3005236.1 hypothetical protein [Candidatus Woesearchaeota archaeon]